MRKLHALASLALASAGVLYASSRPWTQLPSDPTEHHERLARAVGTWDGELTMIVPGGQAIQSKVVETVGRVGGFWNHSVVEGTVMGAPFKGMYIQGYDPDRKKYVGLWIDSSGPTWQIEEGTYDAETDVLRMGHEGPDMTGRVTQQWSTTTYDAEGKRIYQAFMKLPDGSASMTMEIVYTKRAEGAR